MATIPRNEWLDSAKKVPLGQKRRVYHGAECTAAMDVWNNEDSWSAYCHRCHAGGKVYKQYLQRVDASAPVYRKYLDRKALVSLDKLDKAKYKQIVKLLHDKGMSTVTIQDLKPIYNTVDDRLCFSFDGVTLGRDCTGRSGAKWLRYHDDVKRGFVYLQGKNPYGKREPVILCEDLFSAQKIRYYTGYSSLVLLGTNVRNDMSYFVMDKYPVIATDGDLAGHKAMLNIRRRFELLGIPYKVVGVPDGLDPKDLPPDHLTELFQFLESPDEDYEVL